MPSASVVIPAHNEAATIERALDPLVDQRAEVIVVCSGDDDTDAIAVDHEACDVVVRDRRQDGPGVARNRGAEVASGDVVLFTDADTVVPEDWVPRHRRHYEEAEVVGVGGPVDPLEGGIKHRLMFRLLSDWWYRISWPVGFVQVTTTNASYRRAAFFEEGGFDEDLPFMEDTELSLRMRERGTLRYDRTCRVKTSVRRQEGRGYLPLFLQYLQGYLQYYVLDRELSKAYFSSNSEVDREDAYDEDL